MKFRTGRFGTVMQERGGEDRKKRRILPYVLALVGVASSLMWFIFVSRYWSVTTLDIRGLAQIDRGEAENAVYDLLDHGAWRPWDRRNIFFVNKEKLQDELRDRLLAESVTVDKSYPNVLRLIIQERQRSVIIVTDSHTMQVDLHGIVTGDTSASSTAWVHDVLAGKSFADVSHPPIILVGSVDTTTSSEQLADPETVRRWIDAYHTLIASRWHFKTFTIDRVTSRTLKIAVQGGFDVIMDVEMPLEPQIETFNKFLQAKPKDAVIREYINVTVPGRVSFK